MYTRSLDENTFLGKFWTESFICVKRLTFCNSAYMNPTQICDPECEHKNALAMFPNVCLFLLMHSLQTCLSQNGILILWDNCLNTDQWLSHSRLKEEHLNIAFCISSYCALLKYQTNRRTWVWQSTKSRRRWRKFGAESSRIYWKCPQQQKTLQKSIIKWWNFLNLK